MEQQPPEFTYSGKNSLLFSIIFTYLILVILVVSNVIPEKKNAYGYDNRNQTNTYIPPTANPTPTAPGGATTLTPTPARNSNQYHIPGTSYKVNIPQGYTVVENGDSSPNTVLYSNSLYNIRIITNPVSYYDTNCPSGVATTWNDPSAIQILPDYYLWNYIVGPQKNSNCTIEPGWNQLGNYYQSSSIKSFPAITPKSEEYNPYVIAALVGDQEVIFAIKLMDVNPSPDYSAIPDRASKSIPPEFKQMVYSISN